MTGLLRQVSKNKFIPSQAQMIQSAVNKGDTAKYFGRDQFIRTFAPTEPGLHTIRTAPGSFFFCHV